MVRYWEETEPALTLPDDSESRPERRAKCILCAETGSPYTRAYETAKQRSDAWVHTVRKHSHFKPIDWGTRPEF
jgi:hypothetical protein